MKVNKCTQNANYSYLTSATISGFAHVYPHDSETALVNAIATIGPFGIFKKILFFKYLTCQKKFKIIKNQIKAVAIQGNLNTFQFYSTGIYSDSSCTKANINHAVTAVGYGTQGTGKDYYIIKNSWGTSWGMQGYGYIARNKGNMCGIASYASYPRF